MKYNRIGVVEYARKYATDHNKQYSNYDDPRYGKNSDCANFASQCLRNGSDIPENAKWTYGRAGFGNRTESWAQVEKFRAVFIIPFLKPTISKNPNILKAGNLIFRMKFGKAQHVYVVVENYNGGNTIKVCQRGQDEENYTTSKQKEELKNIRLNYNLNVNIKSLEFYHIPDEISIQSNNPSPTPNPSQNKWQDRYGTETLKLDSTGVFVSNLQEDLNKLGYNCGNVDGNFGKKTEKAVRAFQKSNSLKQDGKVGNNTKQKIWEKIS